MSGTGGIGGVGGMGQNQPLDLSLNPHLSDGDRAILKGIVEILDHFAKVTEDRARDMNNLAYSDTMMGDYDKEGFSLRDAVDNALTQLRKYPPVSDPKIQDQIEYLIGGPNPDLLMGGRAGGRLEDLRNAADAVTHSEVFGRGQGLNTAQEWQDIRDRTDALMKLLAPPGGFT